MNSETRIPACLSSRTTGASCARWPTTSSPPSVVRSVRFSGTRQAACGRVFSAMSTISRVAAISKLSGLSISRFQARDVVIANMPAILAQVGGDAIAARSDRELGGAHRVGVTSAARVADRGHVIDVDAEAETFHA